MVVVLYNINSISYAPVVNFRQVSGIGQNYTIVYVLIAVLAVLYIAFLAISFRVLSKPIKKINGIVYDINKGEHKIKYKVGGSREFSEIATGLSQIDKKLAEKDKLIKVASDEYEKVVPKQFIKYLGKRSFSELELGGSVTKEVTTMFCDIRNSTLKSETLSLTDNFKFINDYLGVVTPIIRKHQGFVDKYLGDGVLAVFSNANNAMLCAKEIVREVNIKNALEKNRLILILELVFTQVKSCLAWWVMSKENRQQLFLTMSTTHQKCKKSTNFMAQKSFFQSALSMQ